MTDYTKSYTTNVGQLYDDIMPSVLAKNNTAGNTANGSTSGSAMDLVSTKAKIPFAGGLAYSSAAPKVDATPSGEESPWYQNSSLLGNAAGLGSALVELAALPSQIDLTRTQTSALKQNIATAKQEQNRRNSNVSSFNAVRG